MGGLGPMQGQANHFKRYAPEKIQYGIDRYTNESRRLYRTMDEHLAKSTSGYLVGDKVTIADISCWGWIASHRMPFSSSYHPPPLTIYRLGRPQLRRIPSPEEVALHSP